MDFFYSLFILFFKSICFFIENSHYIIAAIVVLMLPPLVTLIQQKKDLYFFTKRYLDEIYQWKKLKESLILFIIYFIFFLFPLEKFSENILIQNISLSIRFSVILTVIHGMTIFVRDLYFHLSNIFFNDKQEYYFNKIKNDLIIEFKKNSDEDWVLKKFGENYPYYINDLLYRKNFSQLIKEISFLKEIIREEKLNFIFKYKMFRSSFNSARMIKKFFSEENSHLPSSVKEQFLELWIELFDNIAFKNEDQMGYIVSILASSFDSGFFNKKIVSKNYLISLIRSYFNADIGSDKNLKEKNYSDYSYFSFHEALTKTGENKREDFGFDFFVDLALAPLLMKNRLEKDLDPNNEKIIRLGSLDKLLNSIAIQFSSYCLHKGIDEFGYDIKRSIYKLINKNKIIQYIKEMIEKDEETAHNWDVSLKSDKDFYKFLLKGFLKDYFYHLDMESELHFLKNQNIPSDMKNKLNRENIDDLVNKLMEQFKVNQRK